MNRTSIELKRIAVSVSAFGRPSLSLAASTLLRLANEFEPEYQEDVHRIMERGLPPVESRSGIIKSNYPLESADIFISFPVKFYDENDKPAELPDTLETQQQLVNGKRSRAHALIVWPDIDMLAEYDAFDGRTDTSQTHGVHPDEVGAENIRDVMAAMGPGSLITNAEFKQIAKLHGYQTSFLFDSY